MVYLVFIFRWRTQGRTPSSIMAQDRIIAADTNENHILESADDDSVPRTGYDWAG